MQQIRVKLKIKGCSEKERTKTKTSIIIKKRRNGRAGVNVDVARGAVVSFWSVGAAIEYTRN